MHVSPVIIIPLFLPTGKEIIKCSSVPCTMDISILNLVYMTGYEICKWHVAFHPSGVEINLSHVR